MNQFVNGKVFAFDLDGTLVNDEKKILPESKKMIEKIMDEGGIIALCSGRLYEGILPLAKELELDKRGGFILAYNGGYIRNVKTDEVILDVKLTFNQAKALHDYMEEHKLSSITYSGDNIITTNPINEYIRAEEKCINMKAIQVDDFDKFLVNGVNKLLGTDEPSKIQEIIPLMKNKFSDVEVYISQPFFLEVIPLGIVKGKSLDILLKSLGKTEKDLFAFGDSYNDLSMLDYAGVSVVMDNADDEIKKHASYITHNNNDDGIAYALEKIYNGEWL